MFFDEIVFCSIRNPIIKYCNTVKTVEASKNNFNELWSIVIQTGGYGDYLLNHGWYKNISNYKKYSNQVQLLKGCIHIKIQNLTFYMALLSNLK